MSLAGAVSLGHRTGRGRLAGDPEVMRCAGRSLAPWTAAREYGLTDADGARPDWGAHFRRDVVPRLSSLMPDLMRS